MHPESSPSADWRIAEERNESAVIGDRTGLLTSIRAQGPEGATAI